MPEECREGGNEEVQTVEVEAGVQLFLFADVLCRQDDGAASLAEEVHHLRAVLAHSARLLCNGSAENGSTHRPLW